MKKGANMKDLNNIKDFPGVSSEIWNNRKHILGFCDKKLDYNIDIKSHQVFEYVYFAVFFNNDRDQIFIDDEGNEYSSREDFNDYIIKRFPGYLENSKCYGSIAYQGADLGIVN